MITGAQLLAFFGRLHPVLLHLPFGVFVAILAWEAMGRRRGERGDSRTRGLLARLLAVATLVSAGTGWLLGQEAGYGGESLDLHRTLGLVLAGVSLGVASSVQWRVWWLYVVTLVAYGGLLVITGHLGGTMTHGEDFLFEPFRETTASRAAEDALSHEASSSPAPEHELLRSRCASCHNPQRRRGKLSIETIADLTQSAVVAGSPERSELVRRLRLPLDHEKHMPPASKRQLEADEIAAIERWIAAGLPEAGSGFGAAPGGDPGAKPAPLAARLSSRQAALVEALRARQVHVEIIAPETGGLWIDTRAAQSLDHAVVHEMLEGLGLLVEDLSLRNAPLDGRALELLGSLTVLRRLDLSKTDVDARDLRSLIGCRSLRILNLTQTPVDDAVVSTLSALTRLERVYLWETRVTAHELGHLRDARPELEVIDGRGLRSEPIETEPAPVLKESPTAGLRMGRSGHRYEWSTLWLKLPKGREELGNTHGGIVIDRAGDIYFNTDTDEDVMVFDAEGNFVRSFGDDLGPGLHGMQCIQEGDREFLYLAHTRRHLIAKATLQGEILWRLGAPMESGKYDREDQFRPTSVAVAPDGRIFVADGYGENWIHRYDAKRRYLGSFGGRGTKAGAFNTPHGLWIDTRADTPELLVADRENHRLQRFDLEGRFLGIIEGMLRRPCQIHEREGDLVVADLAGRVTILDRRNRLVTHLGDNPDPTRRANNGVPREDWRPGEFLAPHSATWDARGNLYVMDWNRHGRVSKLIRITD